MTHVIVGLIVPKAGTVNPTEISRKSVGGLDDTFIVPRERPMSTVSVRFPTEVGGLYGVIG